MQEWVNIFTAESSASETSNVHEWWPSCQ